MGLIRFILAAAVLLGHCGSSFFGLKMIGGAISVQCFYIISGFLITLVLSEKYYKKTEGVVISPFTRYKTFIGNRFLRLFPLHWIVLLLTALLSLFGYYYLNDPIYFSTYKQARNLGVFPTIYFILSNIFIFGQDILLFLGYNNSTDQLYFTSDFYSTSPPWPVYFMLVPQAWSLALELMFYLISPLFVTKSTKIIALVIGVSLLIRLFFTIRLNLYEDPWNYRFFPNELAFFAAGALSYKIFLYLKSKEIKSIFLAAIWAVQTLFIVFFDYLPLHNIIPFSTQPYIGLTLDKIILYSSLVFTIPFIFKLTNKMKFDRTLGEYSYPIYICHHFIMTIIVHTFIEKIVVLKGDQFGLITLLLTVLFSFLCLKLFLGRIEKLRASKVKAI